MNGLVLLGRPHLRGWSHAVAFVAATALCPILIVFSPTGRAGAAIFAAGTIGLFGVSAAYHRLAWGTRAEVLFSRLDHAMIFVAIGATYTPIAALTLPAGPARFILVVVWGGALVGALTHLLWPTAPRWLKVALYVSVGWCAVLVIDDFWRSLGVAAFVLVLVGGLLHTVGAVVYASERPNPWPRWFGFHEIFHLLVVAAVSTHYVAVSLVA